MKKTKKPAKKYTAYEYALFLLSYSGRSERVLIQRLTIKKYSGHEIQAAVKKLKHYGFINDTQMAYNLIKSRMQAGHGAQKIRAELLQKGFSIDIINTYIQTAEKEFPSEFERAAAFAEKKTAGWKDYSDQKKYRRLYSLLQQRGFTYETTRDVLNTILRKTINAE